MDNTEKIKVNIINKNNKNRALLLFFQHVLTVVLVLSLFAFIIIFYGQEYNITDVMNYSYTNTKYEDTEYFDNIFYNNIRDAIRFGVIKDQFETDGKFNGKKEIDIRAYAYYNQTDFMANSEEPSVSYYLDDLIKWGQLGYSYKLITENYYDFFRTQALKELVKNKFSDSSEEEMKNYEKMIDESFIKDFEENVKSVVLDKKEEKYNQSNDKNETSVSNQNVLEEIYDYDEIEDYTVPESYGKKDTMTFQAIHNEEFYPVNGLPLILNTKNATEYQEFTIFLMESIETAFYNYQDYKHLKLQFSQSNFTYYITYINNGVQTIFTNLEYLGKKSQDLSDDELTQLFADQGKYLFCDYDGLKYSSNTSLKEESIWQEIGSYSYTYPANIKMWIGIRTDYPNKDIFYEKSINYSYNILLSKNIFLLIIIVSILWIVLFFINSFREKSFDINKKKLMDHIPSELIIILPFVIFTFGIISTYISCKFIVKYFNYTISKSMCVVLGSLIFVASLIASIIFFGFYLGFLRRMKSHEFWNRSLVKILINLMTAIYDNPKVLIRTVIPYQLFILINFSGIVFALNKEKYAIVLLIALLAFDLYIGFYLYKENKCRLNIIEGIDKIKRGDLEHKLVTHRLHGDNLKLADAVNSIGEGIKNAVTTSMKDERLKTDLITNVSHDIKTPLTSIISYVDLIKREDIDNDRIREYVDVLDIKSQRLKHLTEDLVEASKISSGSIVLEMEKLNFVQLIRQTLGEFDEKFKLNGLDIILVLPNNPVYIMADSRRSWRVMENIFSNLVKYAMPNTRVYVDLDTTEKAKLTIKNVSAQPLNISATQLTERFMRGDISRNTEGSGLGLYIAKSLIEVQNGNFNIYLDGDLFKVIIEFDVTENSNNNENHSSHVAGAALAVETNVTNGAEEIYVSNGAVETKVSNRITRSKLKKSFLKKSKKVIDNDLQNDYNTPIQNKSDEENNGSN